METIHQQGSLDVTRQEIENYLKMKLYTELTLVREKLGLFEKKYDCDFTRFEKTVNEAEEEDFERWDDYLEWKAFYKKYTRLKEKTNQP